MAVQGADTPPQEHPRVHLDLVVDNTAEQEAEIKRLVGLGAPRVPWELYPVDVVVLPPQPRSVAGGAVPGE